MRSHVVLPGDPVLLLDGRSVVAVGGGLRTLHTTSRSRRPRSSEATSAAASSDAAAAAQDLLLSVYCAAVQRQPHPLLRHVPRYSVESPASRRYQCMAGDPVVALVTRRIGAHGYYMYTGGPSLAFLDAVGFDGASKTSRPRLAEGDVVYCYVKKKKAANYLDHDVGTSAVTPSSLPSSQKGELAGLVEALGGGDVELSCMAAEVGLVPKDWTSNEATFGPLLDGRVLTLPLPYVRGLLTPLTAEQMRLASTTAKSKAAASRKRAREEEVAHASPEEGRGASAAGKEEEERKGGDAEGDDVAVPASFLLYVLGQRVPFDICVGANGLVWVKGGNSADESSATVGARRTVAVSACLTEGQYDTTRLEMLARVESYFPSFA